MSSTIITIPNANLAMAFIPVLIVVVILYRWTMDSLTAVVASARMLLQLLLIGYVLMYVFQWQNVFVVMMVLSVMLCIASWIALRPLNNKRRNLYAKALGAIAIGGIVTLLLVTQIVLNVDPWFSPRHLITLGGMIFANSMNAVSLSAERFDSESSAGAEYQDARRTALGAALIPLTNTLLAVGLVSLPGMMTGQILAGEDPLDAARYQIVVMCMVFGSAGMSAASYLVFLKPEVSKLEHQANG